MTFHIPSRFRENYDPPPRDPGPDRDELEGLLKPRRVDPASIDLVAECYEEESR